MEAIDIVRGLAGFPDRGAGTDAERRAAAWLAEGLSDEGPAAVLEPFWCRPNWALAHAVHAALAVAGSLMSLSSPTAGVAILSITLVSLLADSLIGRSVGRYMTRERASQNVTWLAAGADPGSGEDRVRLLLTANYDAGRAALIHRDWLRRPVAAMRRALKANTPGWLGWLTIATGWLLATAALRLEGHSTHAIGVLQLPPTIGVLIAFALLLDLATATWSQRAGENASGAGVATELAQALRAAPPQHLEVELVLTGAGDHDQTGLRRYLQSHREERTRSNTIVLGIAPCATAGPHWWVSDGQLIPLRYARTLRALAQRIATEEPHLHAAAYKGRGGTSALPARAAGIPAITAGCVDESGVADPQLDAEALNRVTAFVLLLVDGTDAAVGELRPSRVTS